MGTWIVGEKERSLSKLLKPKVSPGASLRVGASRPLCSSKAQESVCTVQLTLEQWRVYGTDPSTIENPHINFDEPKTSLSKYLRGIDLRTPLHPP